MIVARIKGGLGNQLFAYAAARRLALVNNDELVLDSISGFNRDYKFCRKFQLNYFSIPCNTIRSDKKAIFLKLFQRKISMLINLFTKFEKRNYIEQEFEDFDGRVLNIKTIKNKVTTLDGLWQSELYFKEIESTIRKDLKFQFEISEKLKATIEKIKLTESVAIHIRMFGPKGDKKNVSPEYYKKAIEKIQSSTSKPVFYLFTDDVKSAEEILYDLDINYINISETEYFEVNDVAELLIMSRCDHHIIANSTFSWWGAWLAKHEKQKVLYPLPTEDTSWCWNYKGQMPEDWIPIENSSGVN